MMSHQATHFRRIAAAPSNGVAPTGYSAPSSNSEDSGPPEKISITTKLLTVGIVCCILEGAGRKWLVPGAGVAVQAIFYFSKDVFFVLAAITALSVRPRSHQIGQLRGLLVICAMIILLACLPSIADAALVGGVLSIRSMIVIPFLALAVAAGLKGRRDLEVIAKTIGYLAIPVAVLGVLQFYLPSTHVLNRQLDEFSVAVEFSGRVRASGTFAFISGMSALSVVSCWAGCFFLLAPPRQKIGYVFVIAGLTCAAAALNRSGMFFSLALLISVLALSPRGLPAAIVLGIVLGTTALLMGVFDESDDPVASNTADIMTGTFRRHEVSDSVESRGGWMLASILDAIVEIPTGRGLGQGQQAENAVSSGQRRFAGYETEMARIVFEIGDLGLFGVLLFRLIVMLILTSSLLTAVQTPLPLHYLRKTTIIALGLFLLTNTVFDHVASTFAWIIAAVALATFEIELRQKQEQRQPAAPSPRGPQLSYSNG
jgi:hypothetical protein